MSFIRALVNFLIWFSRETVKLVFIVLLALTIPLWIIPAGIYWGFENSVKSDYRKGNKWWWQE